MARRRYEVKQYCGIMPEARRRRPASRASARPLLLRSTSVQPVKRSSRFHRLWPWRSNISCFIGESLNFGYEG